MRVKLKFPTLLVFLSILFITGCNSTIPELNKNSEKISDGIYSNNLRINTKKIYAWVNHLPNSKPRFQISGSLELFDNSVYNYKDMKIIKVYVYQGDELLFQFTPKSKEQLLKGKKEVSFSTIKGMLLTPILDVKSGVDLKIVFSDEIKEYKYLIKNVAIEEVY